MDTPWKEAISQVLNEAGGALHYSEIAERIVELELRESLGATPASTVNATINMSMQGDGESSPFYRASRGYYGLKSQQTHPAETTPSPDDSDESAESGVIRALGMFWLRSNVYWKATPQVLGRQQLGADPVDFCKQRGVYLLYDGREVIYVGRAVDRPLGQRLYEHTYDRLNGRWDRFSWFGLYDITDTGTIDETFSQYEGEEIITAFEAILIESLEPAQNRRRGDSLNAVEFMQARDPELDRRQMRSMLQELLHKVEQDG